MKVALWFAMIFAWFLPQAGQAVQYTLPHWTCSTTCLDVGDGLMIGHSLTSPNGAYRLTLQSNHDLVLTQTSNNTALWSSGTANSAAVKLSINCYNCAQELYLLELTDSTGTAVWWPKHSDGTAAYTYDPFFLVQDDGNLVEYTPIILWTTHSDVIQGSNYDNRVGATYFRPGSNIVRPSTFTKTSPQCTLQFATAGNMSIVYFDPISQTNMTMWSSNTTNTGSTASMQTDGNFVIYNASHQAVFNSGTSGHPLDWMVWQYDCNMVIYDSSPQWARFGL
jgi:hypothetical protein